MAQPPRKAAAAAEKPKEKEVKKVGSAAVSEALAPAVTRLKKAVRTRTRA